MRRSILAIMIAIYLVSAAAHPASAADTLVALLPDTSGFYNLQYHGKLNDQPFNLPCRIFLPHGYESAKDPFPLLVFLHGQEQRGTDLAALLTIGPEKRLREDQGFRDNTRFVIVSPQCPPNLRWDDAVVESLVTGLVEEISKRFRVDAERVHLTGAEMGATAALGIAALHPDRYASVAAVAPRGMLSDETAGLLRHVNSYIASPQNEQPTMESYMRIAEAIGLAHGDPHTRIAGNNTRECIQWFYSDNGNYDWFSQKMRLTATEKKDRETRDAREMTDFIASLPKTPGFHKLRYFGWGGDKKQDIPFELIIPEGYKPDNGPWPTILFLCGAGEVAMDLSGVDSNGPGVKLHGEAPFQHWSPFIIIEPIHDNSPERCRAVLRLVRELQKNVRIDPDRTYVTGLSLGGTSTWVTSTQAPDLFAAAVSINGRERCNDVAANALKYITTWIIVGGDDGDFFKGSCHMQDLLAAAGNDTHLTVIPHEGHGSWWRYYQDRRFYDWLLQHHRLDSSERAMRDQFPTTAPADMLAHADKHPQVLQPGHHWLEYHTQLNGKPFDMRYGLFLPAAYSPTTTERFPMMVYLHVDEHRQTDQSMIFEWGSGVDPRRKPEERAPFPMIGLVPQLPQDKQWTDPEVMKITLSLIGEVQKYVRVDPDRIYGSGAQNGANGIWTLALEAPDQFAAIAPHWGGVVRQDEVTSKLRYLAARITAPLGDQGAMNAARQMVDSLRKARDEVQLAFLPPLQDPTAWVPYYTNPEMTNWLLAHRRMNPSQRQQRQERDNRLAAEKLPTAPGDYLLTFETVVDGKPISIRYRLWLPSTYDKSPDRYPLLTYLHDANMPATQPSDGMWGPDLALRNDSKQASAFGFIGLFPQLPSRQKWDDPAIAKATAALVNEVIQKLRVDNDRVYATGVGSGGSGACRLVMEAPDLFAAVTACAPRMKPEEIGQQLRGIATWVVGPADDTSAAEDAKKIADAIQKTQTEVQLTQLDGAGSKRWLGFYGNPSTYEWLLRHRRPR